VFLLLTVKHQCKCITDAPSTINATTTDVKEVIKKLNAMFTADLEESLDSARLAERQNELVGVNVFQRLLCYVLRTVHMHSSHPTY